MIGPISEEHSLKVKSSMDNRASERWTLVIPEHLRNAALPICVTLSGMTKVSDNAVHL